MKLPPLFPTLIYVILGALVTLQLGFVTIALMTKDKVVESYQTADR